MLTDDSQTYVGL
jgi:hypothetical protein